MAHVDNSEQQVKQLIEIAQKMRENEKEEIEVYLVGSFIDQQHSLPNLMILLTHFSSKTNGLHLNLKLCHAWNHNSFFKDSLHYPLFQGVFFDLNLSKLFPSTFQRESRGPDCDLRGNIYYYYLLLLFIYYFFHFFFIFFSFIFIYF